MNRFLITFLGSGSAFTVGDGNFQSNILIEDSQSDKKLLLDCGSDIRFSLHEIGLKMSDVTDIYISHPHSDHVGGLECAAFSTQWVPNREKTTLFISKHFASDLWNKTLSGGLESIEGEIADIHTYFRLCSIGARGIFEWQGLQFQLVQVVHIMNGFDIVPSYGLLFKINGKTVFWTSDTQFAPAQLVKFYDMADIIFQDCETSQYKSGVHAHYSMLSTLDKKIKEKMWLYHYQPGPKPSAEKDGFAGFITRGQVF